MGGAWRNLALIWMQKQNYPLQVVQQFELPAREAMSIAKLIASQSLSSLERVPGVSKRRMENISYAAMVLQGLIETFGFETLCFSAFGLREGLLFEALDPQRQLGGVAVVLGYQHDRRRSGTGESSRAGKDRQRETGRKGSREAKPPPRSPV